MFNQKRLIAILGVFVLGSLCFSGCQKNAQVKEKPEAVTSNKEAENNQEVQQKDGSDSANTIDEETDTNTEHNTDTNDEFSKNQAGEENEGQMPMTEKPEDIADNDERIAEFFSDSVLTGDSISKHFGNFITKNQAALPGKMMLLSEGSFSLHNAKEEPTPDSTFPLYKGEKMKIEDAVALMGVHNVFMFYGINDLGRGTPKECLELYDEQIDRIMQKNPDAKVFIISPTYLHKDKANVYKKLNNKNIKKFNDLLIEYCNTKQKATYIDLATKLQDDEGNLKAEYCNDNYCHHTEKAFAIWIDVLTNQAKTEVVK